MYVFEFNKLFQRSPENPIMIAPIYKWGKTLLPWKSIMENGSFLHLFYIRQTNKSWESSPLLLPFISSPYKKISLWSIDAHNTKDGWMVWSLAFFSLTLSFHYYISSDDDQNTSGAIKQNSKKHFVHTKVTRYIDRLIQLFDLWVEFCAFLEVPKVFLTKLTNCSFIKKL